MSLHHSTSDKVSAGPRMVVQLTDRTASLFVKVFQVGDANLRLLEEAKAVVLHCTQERTHPRTTEPLNLLVGDHDKVMYTGPVRRFVR